MVNNLQLLRSLTAGSKPAALAQGQIALNLADKILFVGDGTDTITYLDGTTAAASGTGLGFFESDLDISTAQAAAEAYTNQKIADLVDSAPALLNTLNELAAAIGDDENFVTTITNSVAGVQTNLDTEAARALAAESLLSGSISSESVRAQAAEADIATDLAAEVSRASAAENNLEAAVAAEEARALAAEGVLAADLATEVSARFNADSNEEAARIAADQDLQVNIDSEAASRASADNTLQSNLDAEAARALAAEGVLTADLATEVAARQAADASAASNVASIQAALSADISTETARALSAESSLSGRISSIENGIDLGTF